MAAKVLGGGTLFEAKPTVGRKFLLAGQGGLNLTHSEPFEKFLTRYREHRDQLEPWLREFGPSQVRQWCEELGFETFVGSSKRVFPRSMKAAPLLRAWLQTMGVDFKTRHRWIGWNDEGELLFETPAGITSYKAEATILALGGASWPKMGSTGEWVPILRELGVKVEPFLPSNVGYEVAWTDHFRERFAGTPIKSVGMHFGGEKRQGELMVTRYGLEGSLLYPFSPLLRRKLPCPIELDLLPGVSLAKLEASMARERGSRSLTKYLRQSAGIEGVKMGLVYEFLGNQVTPAALKAVSLPLQCARPIEEAISSAGGIAFNELDGNLMLKKRPGVFCAGEMLDWEAPTGGYLLTACFATGRAAGLAVLDYLRSS